jgi:primase-polymerase (primpol)-like protein
LGDGLTVLDLDGCRDPEAGAIRPEAAVVVSRLDSYTEVSPSGTGLHVWCKGLLPPGGRRNGGIELYDRSRYITPTGNRIEGTPNKVEERTAQLATLHGSVFEAPGPRSIDADLDDAVIILTLSTSKTGDALSRLEESNSPPALSGLLLVVRAAHSLEVFPCTSKRVMPIR